MARRRAEAALIAPAPPITAAPNPARTRPRTRALVASGQQIDLGDRKQRDAFRRRASKNWWQERAWWMENEVPLIGFAHDYVRDSMSRVALFPAMISDDPSAPPIPLDADNTPDGLDPELCAQILNRLAPFSDFMGSVAQKIDVAGECHVALIPDPDEIDGERCDVFSTDEFFVKADHYYYREDASDQNGVLLDPSSFVFRIWQPDGQYRNQPTSHMRRLIGIADTLLMLTQLIRGISRSRIAMSGRLLAIAEEFSLESATRDGQAPTEDAGDGEGRTDPFMEDFLEAAEAAILDHESAAAALPMIVRAPMAVLKDGIMSIDLDRKFDETIIKLRQELREEIANGVNLPREVLLGIGATNHWNAEEIRNQSWLTHLEPRAMGITAATTTAFYRPQLLANDVDPDIVRRCVIGYDPSWFIGAPDLADDADKAYEQYLISGDYYRQVKRIPADAEPDKEEIEQRLWIKQQERLTIRETGNAPPGANEATPVGPMDAPLDDEQPDAVDVTPQPQVDKSAPPMTASAAQSALDRLGPKLVGIERDVRTRLHIEANHVVTAALERAGMRVRQKTRNRPAVAAQIIDVPYREIPARIGPQGVHALGLKDRDLIDGALANLRATFLQQVTRAQHAAAAAAAAAAGQEFDSSSLDRRTASDHDAGWDILAAGITAIVTSLLYNPHPAAPEHGEFDDSSIVPLGLIRASLDRAGGASTPMPTDTRPLPSTVEPRAAEAAPPGAGATMGPSMLDEFKQQLGITDDRYEWVYGDAPRREFPPHLDLDGVTFTAWDDDVLANTDDGWLGVDFYAPNDHSGCQCDFIVTFAQAE